MELHAEGQGGADVRPSVRPLFPAGPLPALAAWVPLGQVFIGCVSGHWTHRSQVVGLTPPKTRSGETVMRVRTVRGLLQNRRKGAFYVQVDVVSTLSVTSDSLAVSAINQEEDAAHVCVIRYDLKVGGGENYIYIFAPPLQQDAHFMELRGQGAVRLSFWTGRWAVSPGAFTQGRGRVLPDAPPLVA